MTTISSHGHELHTDGCAVYQQSLPLSGPDVTLKSVGWRSGSAVKITANSVLDTQVKTTHAHL